MPEPGSWFSVIHYARPFSLNEELRWHPMKRHEQVKEWRAAFRWLALDATNPLPRFARPVEIEIIPHGVKFDIDGIAGCGKAALDGLVDARIIPGDDRRYVVGLTYRLSEPGLPALELRIREA